MPKVFANGRNLITRSSGTGDPVAFLSGLGGDHRAFAVPVRAFGTNFRALALDNRDVGRSDRAEGGYSTADMADDVAAWFEALGLPPAHVVGQSLGGLIAQELALRHPERVRSLTLVSTHAGTNAWKKAVLESWVVLKRRDRPGGVHQGDAPLARRARVLREHGDRSRGWSGSPSGTSGRRTPDAFARQARAAIRHQAADRPRGRSRRRRSSWSASSTSSTRPTSRASWPG